MMPLQPVQPVTIDGHRPSVELVVIIQQMQAQIRGQADLIAALTLRVEALEGP